MGEEGRGDAAPPQNGGTQPGGIEPADPRGAGANLVGRLLGGVYRVDKLITGGAMGVVYLARQLSVDREVIVKTLRLSDSDTELNEILVRRFRREAVATAHLDHPNTVRLIDYGDDRGLQYLVLERLRGRSLATVLATEGPLPAREVARIGALICRSLAEAHAAGVIHRDLKPENVFLCDYPGEPDVVKVMDFGVARLMPHTDQHVSRITTAGLTVGTPMYIAPEQARGLETSPATDLYSLGVVLFELLVGRPPFEGGSGMEIAIRHIKEPPPPLPIAVLPPAQARAWQDLVTSLLAKDPAWRPVSATDVAGRLEALDTPSAPAPGPASLDTTPAPAATATFAPAPTYDAARGVATPRRVLLAATALASLLLGVLLGHLLG